MPKYDERTSRGWPLPHKANKLFDDVERIRETLSAIDSELSVLEDKARVIADEHVEPIEQRQDILDARMDVIAGQTTEDSEILDARVDAKGVTHQNLGHNVRTLHSEVIELDESVQYGISEFRGLMRQFNELAYAQIQGELNTKEAHERRKAELAQEIQTRIEADDELHDELARETLIREEQTESLQTQTQELSEAGLKNALNLREATERGRDALKQEVLRRAEDDEVQQEQIDSLAQSDIQQSLNLHDEAEQRRKVADDLASETTAREENDEVLRQKISAANDALSLEKSERLRADDDLHRRLDYEEYARLSDDTAQQGQINSLAESNIQQSLNLHREIAAREEAEAVRAEQDTHIQSEIDNLTEATLRGAINLSEEAASRRSANLEEAQARTVQGELLQARIDDLSNASIRQNLNASHEAQTRREGLAHVNTQLDALQKQTANHHDAIVDLIEAMFRVSLNIHEAFERRREALNREADTRAENDDLLQIQIDNLTAGAIQAAMNLHEALERGREALHQETQTRSEHDTVLQRQADESAQAIIQQSVNLAREADKRRELEQVVSAIKSPVDWSKSESLAIPEPRCAVVNFTGLKAMPTSKTVEIPAYMEFWDMQGNYFKKPIVCSAQGSSSLGYVKKNVKFDLLNDDGEEFDLKIGNWVVQDGFHLKAYYTDFFRGVGVTSYKLWDEIMETRPCKKALVDVDGMNTTATGTGNISDLTLQIDTGALCHPDGFPCIVYLNGTFYGVYSWQIKKQRKNYHLDKSTVEHIHLDGTLSTANFWNGTINWSAFEIRNPNKLYTMDGKKYDGDAPKELIDETSENYKPGNKDHVRSATVKRYIQSLVQRFAGLKQTYATYRVSEPERVKAAYEELFDWENMRDYLIFSDVIKNSDGYAKNWQWTTYDGVKWYVNAYDLDMSYGGHWQGIQITAPLTNHITTSTALPVYYVALLYKAELEARYRKLRDAGIIDVEHIVSKLADWTARIGEKNYELEFERWPNSPCILNYNDSVDRVRKWLTVEIANMDKVYHYGTAATESFARTSAIRAEAKAREDADDWEAYLRASETSALQIQVSDLARVSLEDRFRFLAIRAKHEADMQQETHERSKSESSLQTQIDELAFAVMKVALNDREARERLSEFVGRLYQAVADTGNLNYKGAGVASTNEVSSMLADVMTGNDSETTASEIPEELRDQVATSSEINEMLDEIIPNRS